LFFRKATKKGQQCKKEAKSHFVWKSVLSANNAGMPCSAWEDGLAIVQ